MRRITVVWLAFPEVPVTFIGSGPAAMAVASAARVRMLLPVVGLVPKVAVTPGGNGAATSVTVPVKPLSWCTVIVSVTVLFCGSERLIEELDNVKPGAAVTLSAIVELATSVPEVPVTVMFAGPPIAAAPDAESVRTL